MKKKLLIPIIFKVPIDESDLFLTLGTASLSFGMFQIYQPLGYITAGIIFLVIAWFQAKVNS